MSYSVLIIRPNKQPITLKEWLDYIESDQELHFLGAFVAVNPKTGERIEAPAPGLAEWIDPKTGEKSWFNHRSGTISVGNANLDTLIKMHAIAGRFGAIVRGESGEQYDAAGNILQTYGKS